MTHLDQVENYFLKLPRKFDPAHVDLQLNTQSGLSCLVCAKTVRGKLVSLIYEFPTMPPTGKEILQAVAVVVKLEQQDL